MLLPSYSGVLERVGPGDPDEAWIARTHRTIDVVLIARRDEKESRLFDELAVLLPELEMEAVLLEAVGDTAAVQAVLQLTHAVVVEGGAVDRVGHGASGLTCGMSRFIADRRPRRDVPDAPRFLSKPDTQSYSAISP